MGPRCPDWQDAVPFLRTQGRLGQAFRCKGCAVWLELSKSQGWIVLPLLILFWLLKGSASNLAEVMLLLLVLWFRA